MRKGGLVECPESISQKVSVLETYHHVVKGCFDIVTVPVQTCLNLVGAHSMILG